MVGCGRRTGAVDGRNGEVCWKRWTCNEPAIRIARMRSVSGRSNEWYYMGGLALTRPTDLNDQNQVINSETSCHYCFPSENILPPMYNKMISSWHWTSLQPRSFILGRALLLSLLCLSNYTNAAEDVVENLVCSSNTTLICYGMFYKSCIQTSYNFFL